MNGHFCHCFAIPGLWRIIVSRPLLLRILRQVIVMLGIIGFLGLFLLILLMLPSGRAGGRQGTFWWLPPGGRGSTSSWSPGASSSMAACTTWGVCGQMPPKHCMLFGPGGPGILVGTFRGGCIWVVPKMIDFIFIH